MAHSIELLFDADTDAAIRSIWTLLSDAGLPSQSTVISPTNRPHVTLVAARAISGEVDDALRGLSARLPVSCVIGAPLIFAGPRLTLARLIVPSAQLLALHEEVYRLTCPHLAGEPFEHCRPGHWTAHATLGRRFTATEAGAALAIAGGRAADLAGELVGLRRWDSDERVDHILVG